MIGDQFMNPVLSAFGSSKPSRAPETVDAVLELLVEGPYPTKSGGKLDKLFEFNSNSLFLLNDYHSYFDYDEEELARLPKDIRGLRSYTVHGLNVHQANDSPSIGGVEFHRLRKELFFVLDGMASVAVEDVYGGKKKFMLDPQKGLYILPFILHTYTVTAENTRLLVVANTIFNHNNDLTKDTYSLEAFRELQKQYHHE